jgi:hypothetical protein
MILLKYFLILFHKSLLIKILYLLYLFTVKTYLNHKNIIINILFIKFIYGKKLSLFTN